MSDRSRSSLRSIEGDASEDRGSFGSERRLRAFASRVADLLEVGRGSTQGNIPAMEGLRGIAVTLVFFVHYGALMLPNASPDFKLRNVAETLAIVGHTGVDLFFLLSGFLIYGSLVTRAPNYVKYARRRVARIYPTFLAVFAIYVLLSLAFPERSKIPTESVQAATYIAHNLLLLPGVFPLPAMITVAWSLSYEMLFYLVCPILVALFGLRGRRVESRIAILVVLGVVLYPVLTALVELPRFLMFIAGAIVFEIRGSRVQMVPNTVGGMLGFISGILALRFLDAPLFSHPGHIAATFFGFAIGCWHVFATHTSPVTKLLSWTPLRWLGNMSYSYYLVHGLALHGFFFVGADRLFRLQSSYWGLLPFAFLATLQVSFVLFVLVERRFSLGPGVRGGPAAEGGKEVPRALHDQPEGRIAS